MGRIIYNGVLLLNILVVKNFLDLIRIEKEIVLNQTIV